MLVAKTERGEKCKEEAREGLRVLTENSKKQIKIIKMVLENHVIDTKNRFEATFKTMFDIIGNEFNNEVVAAEQLASLAQSAIENGRPLDETFYLKGKFGAKVEYKHTNSRNCCH